MCHFDDDVPEYMSNQPEQTTDDENSRPWWDTDDAIASLTLEKSVRPDETNAELAKRLLEESAPQAASSIIQLALHSRSDSVRLNASRYITDLLFADDKNASAAAGWEKLVGEVVSTAELLTSNASDAARNGLL